MDRSRHRARAASRPGTIGGVVIGGDYQGLGIVRSLGRRGIPTVVVDDELSVSSFSRYRSGVVRVPRLRTDEELLAALDESRRRYGLDGWILYPTRDETVASISRNRERLLESFRVPTPPWETVEVAWDKRRTYALANELGIPTPRTWYPTDAAELPELEPHLPLVMKPAIKEHFFYATKAKAWRADTVDELHAVFARASELLPAGEVMLQELVPGNGEQQFAFCALFRDGAALAEMVVSRRRQHPPDFGRASTFVVTVDEPALRSASLRFLSASSYYGLVELEYKLDPRDGHYRLLDVNARTWGYHTLGVPAGVDFPYLLYLDQTGEQFEPCIGRPGVSWVRLITDLPTAAGQLMRRRPEAAYIRSFLTKPVESVFCRDDPIPGLAELALTPYLAVRRGL